MADISKIKLPSGNEYNLKDEVARQAIAGGISFIIAWNGNSEPVVADIPAGVVVKYNGTNYTGTLSADNAQAGAFYLLKRDNSETTDNYSEYVPVGTTGAKTWEKLGDVQIDLSSLGSLAYKDNVTLNKGTKKTIKSVTAASAAASTVSFANHTTKNALGENASFSLSNEGAAFLLQKSALDKTTIPNITSAGQASTWGFAIGTGNDAETLIISGANGSAPTLGTPIEAATGSFTAPSQGSANVITDAYLNVSEISVSVDSADSVPAITQLGAAEAAAQTITLNSEDVGVAEYDNLDVTVS